MEEFPSNSNTNKVVKKSSEPKKSKSLEDERKVERIVTSEVVRRKKPLGTRFMETFAGGNARTVFGYVLYEVLVPAAKDMVSDATSTGVDRMLYGETSRSNRGRHQSTMGRMVSEAVSRTQYNSISSQGRGPARDISRKARSTHDFDEILLESRHAAEEVIDQLFSLTDKYGEAKVADLYMMVGITPGFMDERWGWTDMRGSRPVRTRSNLYLLDLPQPIELD